MPSLMGCLTSFDDGVEDVFVDGVEKEFLDSNCCARANASASDIF